MGELVAPEDAHRVIRPRQRPVERAVMDDRNRAIALGEAGRADALQMTWPNAIAKLLLP